MSVPFWRREKNLNAKFGNLVSECGLILMGRNCIVVFSYHWMKPFRLQRTAGSNCPIIWLTTGYGHLSVFLFDQIPFMWYWGLALWVGELKSGVDHVETKPPNASLLPCLTEETGKRRVDESGISTLGHCISACQTCFILVVQTCIWLMWPWSYAATLFPQHSAACRSSSSGRLVSAQRILHSNNQACPQRGAGWSKVCLQ